MPRRRQPRRHSTTAAAATTTAHSQSPPNWAASSCTTVPMLLPHSASADRSKTLANASFPREPEKIWAFIVGKAAYAAASAANSAIT